jgi:hypothetical protein
MSKDPEDLQTKPTIETVLQQINPLGADIDRELGSLKAGVGAMMWVP